MTEYQKIHEEIKELSDKLEEIEEIRKLTYKEYIDKLEELRKLNNLTFEQVSRAVGKNDRQYSYNILKQYRNGRVKEIEAVLLKK